MEKTDTNHTTLSRRDLLKAIAAGSSAMAAAAFLPARWTRPIVKAGVLPAHAQGTCDYVLTIDEVYYNDNDGHWVAIVSWTPHSPTEPIDLIVTFGDKPVTILDGAWYDPPDDYYKTGFSFDRDPTAVGWTLTVTVFFTRICAAADTFDVPN